MKNKSQKKNKENKISKKVRNFDINLHQTMDASVWAREYRRRFGGKKSLLMGWFANAIMCGWDHGARQREQEAREAVIPMASRNIEHVDIKCAPNADFSSVEERSLTVAAAQYINDFLAVSEKHTVYLGENSCGFYDDCGKSLICRVSSCALGAAVYACYDTWMRDVSLSDEIHWDWPYDLDAIDAEQKSSAE